ncbi:MULTISPECIES: MetQ/NlpA family ABC transporter substrate-binding protein [Ureibacillus]|jgi:D-methionine transport system substrate-binding protein|uniref:Lipoprotein n=1 Tax=Ureibacillus thermosphaericus TaxID=51173 RepID=A0A840PWI4_URETH|nr:MetQ/NlpA family ABC transporter substrate-binding protein [Ureibacillus thermosphaericus]MBB5148538.1 D-methionine transport system substrate-binding protein [Ureibacillus thermosphaericus]NKZ31030.1 ABC transporter substrate-binding protein [Ureibacillus thermosphaericus]
MKKVLSFLFLSVLVLVLAACGTSSNSSTDEGTNDDQQATEKVTLKVGASHTPHAVILEKAKPILAEEGIELEIVPYQDYVLPNQDLNNGDLDANYFQHIPYLEQKVAEEGYDLVNAGGIHIEPMGIYSKKYQSLDELPDGATILISNSIPDHGRILSLLEANGLITLKEGIDKTKATLEDIVENPKNLKIEASDAPEMMVTYYENKEGDAVVINSNFAIDAGINPVEDSIAIEGSESPYVNVIAVRSGDENREEIKKLVEVLRTKEIQDFILEEWGGSVVPVSE